MSDNANTRIPPWTLGEQLGEGGNAVVWRASDDSGRQVALKVLKSQRLQSEPYQRFLREIEALERLTRIDFVGVLPLLSYHLPVNPSRRDAAWLAMPVARNIRSDAQDAPTTRILARVAAIADTLSRLSSEGMSHRDIKPENIYIHENAVKLGDFGLVALPDVEPLTTGAKALGPRHYIAPEMILDPTTADGPPADVYSLAKTLWVLLTSQRFPLPGQHRSDDAPMTVSASLIDSRGVQLDLLIEACTATAPANRPTAAEMRDELNAMLNDTTSHGLVPELGDIGRRLRASMSHIRGEEQALARRKELASLALEKLSVAPQTIHARLQAAGLESTFSPVNNPTIVDAVIDGEARRFHQWSDGGAACVIFQLPGRTVTGHTPGVTFWSGVGAALNVKGALIVAAGHVMATNQLGYQLLWSQTYTGNPGTALMERSVEELAATLVENLESALERFEVEVERVRRERESQRRPNAT